MLNCKDHKTGDLFDPSSHLGEKRSKMLKESWAGIFREYILPNLPVKKVAVHYADGRGRPTKEIFSVMGAVVLQQMFDLTDEETVESYAFNMMWHYALDIGSLSAEDTYISPKTLWTMRNYIVTDGLHKEIFAMVRDKLSDAFKVSYEEQRIDSTHIYSNMRHLGRLQIFVETIRKFLVNLKRHHKALYEAMDKEFVGKYIKGGQKSVFAMVKPSQSKRRIVETANDLFDLIRRFADNEAIQSMTSYKLMVRVLKEQCIVEYPDDTKGKANVYLKKNRDVPSDSLQNPSDPEASYDGHKGQGYQVQIVETFTEKTEETIEETGAQGDQEDTNSDGRADAKDSKHKDNAGLSLIVYVRTEPAHCHDSKALKPAVDELKKEGLKPNQIQGDTAYGSTDNYEYAKAKGIELIAPVPGKAITKEESKLLEKFIFNDNYEVSSCPAGKQPHKTRRTDKGRLVACFATEACGLCPYKKQCPTRPSNEGRCLQYEKKTAQLIKRRAYQHTEAFEQKYRYRAGIEATNSQLARRTGIKHIRYRGLPKMAFAVNLKAAGLNIFRSAAFKRHNCRKSHDKCLFHSSISLFLLLRRHIFTPEPRFNPNLAFLSLQNHHQTNSWI